MEIRKGDEQLVFYEKQHYATWQHENGVNRQARCVPTALPL